jgi:hypothetical protein
MPEKEFAATIACGRGWNGGAIAAAGVKRDLLAVELAWVCLFTIFSPSVRRLSVLIGTLFKRGVGATLGATGSSLDLVDEETPVLFPTS